MRTVIAFSAIALARIIAAAPDPVITARAELGRRQDTDPALVGWVSTSGASAFSDVQSCDFPATLSTSGSFAQCCAPSSSCNFWTTCNAGAVIGASTSVFCDSGYCNTGVIVPSLGASKGASYLACWPTSLGQGVFTLVKDIGSASVVAPSGGGGSAASASGSATSRGSANTAASTGTARATTSANAASSGTAAPKSTGAAVQGATRPLTGMLGFLAGIVALL